MKDVLKKLEQIEVNMLQNNLYICLPEDLDAKIIAGGYCIINVDTHEAYAYTKRKTREHVFYSVPDGKCYETYDGVLNAAKRMLSENPTERLCITYYELMLHAYFEAGLTTLEYWRTGKKEEKN